jgi:hypothetical protein
LTSVNESLVQLVLEEMLKYKPSLQKILETGDEEDLRDPRYTGQHVIRNLPLLIGVELRRLFSISLRQPDRLRLDQIFSSIERCLQFISFILISQLWDEKKQKNIVITETSRKEFVAKITSLNIDNYIWIIKFVRSLFEQYTIPYFVPEMKDKLNDNFFNEIGLYSPELNEAGYFRFDISSGEMETKCFESEKKLVSLLMQISFLCNYKLASIQEIKVIRARHRAPQYLHTINIHGNESTDPRSMEIVRDSCAESHSVLLLKSQITLDEYLNLTPLIINTGSFLADDKENYDVENDILLYHKSQGNYLMYNGSEVTEKCDLRTLRNYPHLLSQFKDMIDTISGAETLQ